MQQPLGDIRGIGEDPRRAAKFDVIGLAHRIAHETPVFVVEQVGEAAVPHIVGLPVLMQNPIDLVWMLHQIGRKLQADRQIDLHAVELGDVHRTRGEHMVEDRHRRIPFERHRDDLGFVARFAQHPLRLRA